MQPSSLQKKINNHKTKKLMKELDGNNIPIENINKKQNQFQSNITTPTLPPNFKYINPNANPLDLLSNILNNHLAYKNNTPQIIKDYFLSKWNKLTGEEKYTFLKIHGKDWSALG